MSRKFPGPSGVVRASDVLKVGESAAVVVLTVNKAADPEDRFGACVRWKRTRGNGGARQLPDRHPAVTGTVRNLTSYGAFIEAGGRESTHGGMSRICPGPARLITRPKYSKKGDKITAVVLEVDPDNQRISLGLKQALE